MQVLLIWYEEGAAHSKNGNLSFAMVKPFSSFVKVILSICPWSSVSMLSSLKNPFPFPECRIYHRSEGEKVLAS